jgi:hypothetical protein
MNETYSDEFIKSLKKFFSNKKRILNKIKHPSLHALQFLKMTHEFQMAAPDK